MQAFLTKLGLAAALLGSAAAAHTGPAATDGAAADASAQQPVPERLADTLAHYTVQNLVYFPDPEEPGSFMTVVGLGGELYVLDLARYSMRSPDFELVVVGEDLRERVVPAPAPRTLRGSVEGIPGSLVAASLEDGRLTARIDLGGGEIWNIQPWDEEGARPEDHVVYHSRDVIRSRAWRCANTDSQPAAPGPSGPQGFRQPQGTPGGPPSGGSQQLGTPKLTEIAIDVDFNYFQITGSDVGGALHDVERVMNGVEAIYLADVNICWDIKRIMVRTSAAADPYSSTAPGTLLSQFRSHWNNQQTSKRTDHMHLFTGRDLNGGTIGVANCIGCICQLSNSYALSQARFTSNFDLRVGLVSHEIGHVYNALHCCGDCSSCGGCNIMCPCLGGCSGVVTSFNTASRNAITAHRNSRGCLQDGCGSELDMIVPEPGLANAETVFSARGAAAGEDVEFYWAKRTNGTTSVPGCGVLLGLASAHLIGTDQASTRGIANLRVFVPNKAGGRTLHFQAVSKTNCRLSEVITYTFP